MGNNPVEEQLEKNDKERIEEIELEAKSRQVFDPIEKTYNERKRRAPDLRECNRVTKTTTRSRRSKNRNQERATQRDI